MDVGPDEDVKPQLPDEEVEPQLPDEDVEPVEVNAWTEIASAAQKKREVFVHNLDRNKQASYRVEVDRSTIFNDVIRLYSTSYTDLLHSFKLFVKYKEEDALDFGGVSRDLFSAFWEAAYVKMFDGSALLAPASHAGIKMSDFTVLGKILSHGYLCCGFLPTRIVFPVLAGALLEPSVSLSKDIFVQSLSDYLSPVDYKTISDALKLKQFSKAVQASIINIISRFGSREVPTPDNLRLILCGLSEHYFRDLPFAAIFMMNGAIPDVHRRFWQGVDVKQLHDLVTSVIASSSKVLQVLSEPLFQNSNERRVFVYLQQFIGQMTLDEVNRFLRFVTGFSVLTGSHISVAFNGLSGFARCPSSHTCGSVVNVPYTYATYLDFVQDFSCVLNSDEYCWAMEFL